MILKSGRIYRYLSSIAYPSYDCQNCIGMPEYGCYCMASYAGGPGHGPSKWQVFFRKILKEFYGISYDI